MKLIIEGVSPDEVLKMVDAISTQGKMPQDLLNQVKMYANQAAASAGRADCAARNAEMAAQDIKKGEPK